MKRYRILLINDLTGERMLTTWFFSSKRQAMEFARCWRGVTEGANCEILDTKNGNKRIDY